MQYRPDIDGLRACAVLPVVLFHLGFAPFAGGFVGVDVFFVISGYLMARQIDEGCNDGRFTLAGFYERRIRRIFPALFVMLAASWCAAAMLLMPADFQEFSRSLAAASLSVSNHVFARANGYFDTPSDLVPLLHTWSLAVEEQFYVFFPLLMLLLRKRAPGRRLGWLGGIALLSFVLCVWATAPHQQLAYFLLPFRAWELLLGALVALAPPLEPARRMPREIASSLAFVAVLLPVVLYSEKTAFPGIAALAPAIGCALLILLGSAGASATHRLLGTGPLVAVGRCSYSIYLWHWPLIAFTRYYLPQPPDTAQLGLLLLASLLLGWASWRWVETPFRAGRGAAAGRPRVLVAGGLLMATGALAGGFGVFTHGWPGRLDPAALAFDRMLDRSAYDALYERGRCFLEKEQRAADYPARACAEFPAEARRRTRVLVYGDSFGAHLLSGLAARPELQVRQYTAMSCRPLAGESTRCDAVRRRFLDELLPATAAEVIIVSARWNRLAIDAPETATALRATLQALAHGGRRVILFGQTPTFYKPVPRVLATHAELRAMPTLYLRAGDDAAVNAWLGGLARELGIVFVDPRQAACVQGDCLVMQAGQPFHWDFGHLTAAGSAFYAELLARAVHEASASRQSR